MTPIHVTPAGRASADPVAAYRAALVEKAKEAVKEEWRRQADISLAKMLLHPVPRGTMK